MKVFFQIKFSITAKEETQIEEELSNYVLTWLESKYGVTAKRAISACKSLLSDSEFGDPNGLFVETVHYEDVKYVLNIICGHAKLWNRQRDGGNLLLVDGQLRLDTSKPLTKVQTYRILLYTMILRVTERNERPGLNPICLS